MMKIRAVTTFTTVQAVSARVHTGGRSADSRLSHRTQPEWWTKDECLRLEMDDCGTIEWCVDASFVVHEGLIMRGLPLATVPNSIRPLLDNPFNCRQECVGNDELPQPPQVCGGMSGRQQQERMHATKRK